MCPSFNYAFLLCFRKKLCSFLELLWNCYFNWISYIAFFKNMKQICKSNDKMEIQ